MKWIWKAQFLSYTLHIFKIFTSFRDIQMILLWFCYIFIDFCHKCKSINARKFQFLCRATNWASFLRGLIQNGLKILWMWSFFRVINQKLIDSCVVLMSNLYQLTYEFIECNKTLKVSVAFLAFILLHLWQKSIQI